MLPNHEIMAQICRKRSITGCVPSQTVRNIRRFIHSSKWIDILISSPFFPALNTISTNNIVPIITRLRSHSEQDTVAQTAVYPCLQPNEIVFRVSHNCIKTCWHEYADLSCVIEIRRHTLTTVSISTAGFLSAVCDTCPGLQSLFWRPLSVFYVSLKKFD